MSTGKPKEPELNRASILAAASLEFSERGFQGARLEVVASEARITRAMIYYYYGGREGLYLAALEEAYRKIRASEKAIDITGLSPVEAMCKLARFRIDYYLANPVMVALVAIENQQKAVYLRGSKEIKERAGPSLASLLGVLTQGQKEGLFREGVDVVELHQVMVSLGMFNVSNQYTFGTLFSRDMASPERVARTRDLVCELVLGFLSPKADLQLAPGADAPQAKAKPKPKTRPKAKPAPRKPA